MSDRPYPKILRTTEAADATLRAYAREYEIKPFEALIVAIDRLRDPVESEALRASLDAAGKLAERLAADLESAREATRRADHAAAAQEAYALASTERDDLRIQVAGLGKTVDAYSAKMASLKSELGDAANEIRRLNDVTAAAVRLVERRESELAEVRAALETKGAAAALPDDLAPRLAAIAARRDVEPHVMLANVIKNGISKIEASDKYQDAQKAARARS